MGDGMRTHVLGDVIHRITALPLRWQIGTLVCLGLLAIFVVFGSLGRSIADDAKQRTLNEWSSVTRSTASVIDSEIEFQYQRLERVAELLARTDAVGQRQLLGEVFALPGPLVASAVLLDARGTILWQTSAPAVPPEFVAAHPSLLQPLGTGRRYASGIQALDGEAVAALAVPVRDARGAATGVLAVLVRPEQGIVGQLVATARGLAHSGHAELVDQDDRVVAASEARDVLRPGEHPDFYEPLLAHHAGGVGLTAPVGPQDPSDQGQRHDMVFVPLQSVPWGLALGGSDAELSADAARWEGQVALFGGVSLALALLLVWFTTRSVARPILALVAASRRIAAGDLATPVPHAGEGEVRVLAEAFDTMRADLHRALAAEKEVERLKEEFLATVSHELRTPLGFIMGYSTSLLLPDAPEDRATIRRCVQVIADASNELKQLVDDLLDMTKIGSGTLSVTPTPSRIGPLVDSAVERIRVRAMGHRFHTEIPTGLPGIFVDARRIEQVLYNLLDNAIKYSPDGGTITVRAETSATEITVSVLDEGLGIRQDELATVFERFHRGRTAQARGIAGTGLGLAISRGIVHAHGGRIWAESPRTDGAPPHLRGTAIRFTLPLASTLAAPGRELFAIAAGGEA